jgi:hypothetical protein
MHSLVMYQAVLEHLVALKTPFRSLHTQFRIYYEQPALGPVPTRSISGIVYVAGGATVAVQNLVNFRGLVAH